MPKYALARSDKQSGERRPTQAAPLGSVISMPGGTRCRQSDRDIWIRLTAIPRNRSFGALSVSLSSMPDKLYRLRFACCARQQYPGVYTMGSERPLRTHACHLAYSCDVRLGPPFFRILKTFPTPTHFQS